MTLEELKIKSGLSHISIKLYEKEGLISSCKKMVQHIMTKILWLL